MLLQIKLENFEGPLDLLLHLLEKEKVNIYDINISEVIEKYLELIENAEENNLAVKLEFLIMAAELLEIKSNSLLNKKEKKEKEVELKDRIQEYKKYKEIAILLKEIENEYNVGYRRQGEGKIVTKIENEEFDFSNLTLQRIFDEYKKVIRKNDRETININRTEKYSVEEGSTFLENEFKKSKEIVLSKILNINFSKFKIVTLFLVILEFYKENKIEIKGDSNIILEYKGVK